MNTYAYLNSLDGYFLHRLHDFPQDIFGNNFFKFCKQKSHKNNVSIIYFNTYTIIVKKDFSNTFIVSYCPLHHQIGRNACEFLIIKISNSESCLPVLTHV